MIVTAQSMNYEVTISIKENVFLQKDTLLKSSFRICHRFEKYIWVQLMMVHLKFFQNFVY